MEVKKNIGCCNITWGLFVFNYLFISALFNSAFPKLFLIDVGSQINRNDKNVNERAVDSHSTIKKDAVLRLDMGYESRFFNILKY